uniref:Monocarboxylate transporter n=1 Tax=Plectus sambesii TaxID=2011161 RepID=A0A914WXH9_9BILA
MLINAGVTLHLVVCGALMTPSKNANNTHSRKHTYCQLFKTDKLFFFAIGCFCWAGSGQVFYQMMPTFAWHNEVKRTDIVWITSAVGLTDICARLLAALLNHTVAKEHTVFLYASAVFLDALSILTLTLCSSLATFILDGMFFGFAFGMMMGSHGASAFDVFGFQQFPDAIGVGMFAASIGGLSIPLIAGILGDRYGIVWTFRFAAAVAATGSINVFTLAVRKRLTPPPAENSLQSKRNTFRRRQSSTMQML